MNTRISTKLPYVQYPYDRKEVGRAILVFIISLALAIATNQLPVLPYIFGIVAFLAAWSLFGDLIIVLKKQTPDARKQAAALDKWFFPVGIATVSVLCLLALVILLCYN